MGRGAGPPRPSSGVGPAFRGGFPAPSTSTFVSHEATRTNETNSGAGDRRPQRGLEAAARGRRPGRGGGHSRGTRAGWMGDGGDRGSVGRCVGFGLPLGDRGGCRRALLDGPAAGSGHGRGTAGPRPAAGVDLVARGTPCGPAAVRRRRARRCRNRTGLRDQRGREAGGGRGAPLPGPAPRRGGGRRVPATRRLVLPEQPRHPGGRYRGGPCGAPAAPRRGCSADGGRDGAPAGRGGGPLPARRAGRGGSRGRGDRGGADRVPAARPGGGVSAREAARPAPWGRRCRPHGRRPPRRPGCPHPAWPGWSSRAP